MIRTDPVTKRRRECIRWTPARWFLLVMAATHLPLGIAGLVIDQSFPLSARAARDPGSALVFGVFETNGWHSLAALGLGVLALVVTVHPSRARTVALAVGLAHVGIVLQLAFSDPGALLIASNDADQVVHACSATGGIVCGVLTPSRRRSARAARGPVVLSSSRDAGTDARRGAGPSAR